MRFTGGPVKTEEDPLETAPARPMRGILAAIRHLEEAVIDARWTAGIVLRYGVFYGPGTSLAPGQEQFELVRQRKFPIVGDGGGVWSFVHVADAAAATVRAVQHGVPGVYNVVVDDPARVSEWVPALAHRLGAEVALVDRVIAHDGFNWSDARRLMTVPRVNLIVAVTCLATVGDIPRFPDRRKLVAYLGLDPKVRQSGDAPASHGHISKQGSAPVRVALVEASWGAVRNPGPLHAFYQRIRARRGHQIAVTAAARKLACLFWVLLWRQQNYAYGQPCLTAKKLRRLERTAGAPRYRDRRAAGATKVGARATPGRASQRPSKGTAARQTTSP